MIDPFLKELLDKPIDTAARANNVWLPAGRRAVLKGAKAEYHNDDMPRETAQESRDRQAAEKDKKLGSLLTYYASTEIPFERVAQHTGLKLETVIRCMKDRGRLS